MEHANNLVPQASIYLDQQLQCYLKENQSRYHGAYYELLIVHEYEQAQLRL